MLPPWGVFPPKLQIKAIFQVWVTQIPDPGGSMKNFLSAPPLLLVASRGGADSRKTNFYMVDPPGPDI